MRTRYTATEYSRNIFYQMPKFLFNAEFGGMSNDAKILYVLLRDRHELSVNNDYKNKDGEIFLIMTREHMCEMLNMSLKTVIKAVNELKEHELLQEERLGQGKPNRVYLLQEEAQNFQTCNNSMSRNGGIPPLDVENFHPSNTDVNKTDFNNSVERKKPQEKEKKRPSYDEIVAEYTESEELRMALAKYIKMRNAKAFTVTNDVLDGLLIRLDEVAHSDQDKIRSVNKALRSTVKEFYPSKEEDRQYCDVGTNEFFGLALAKSYEKPS